jgi:AcrR family transcriptional regulator
LGNIPHFLLDFVTVPRSTAPQAPAGPTGLRTDAQNNRRRIVEAARAVFAERGLDAPLDDIARRAGVGNATLYRRFPTREDLVAAVFVDRLAEYADAAARSLQMPDAWAGFCTFVEHVCAMQAEDNGARDVLTMSFPNARGLEELRDRAHRDFAELVARAQAAGQLRSDFQPQDFVVLQMANAGVVQGTREYAPRAWWRFVGLMLDACRAEAAHELPPPPSRAQVYRAMRRAGRSARS